MPESIGRLIEQSRGVWGGFGRGQRIAVLGILGASLGMLLWVGVWGHRPDLATLYANLNPADAGQVIEQLKAARVTYQLEDGGTRILVPAGVVHETRIKLASLGLPQGGGVGFELFDRTNFGATDFVQKLNYQRALQGELARTIGQIREVQQARVHIVLPQPTVFSDRERPTTASVVISLRPGARMGGEQVKAVVHLVSGSVEGLRAENVTVIDSAGHMLSTSGDSVMGAGTGGQLEYQRSIEGVLQQRVQGMLDEVLGPGKASVRVSALVEYSHGERTEERIDPNTVVKSETRSSETSKGTSARASGPAGTASNVAPAVVPGGAGNTSNNEMAKEQEAIQYEVGRVVERRSLVAGEVKRLSVAVLVDPPYKVTVGPNGVEQKVPVPRDKTEMEKIRATVMRAVGYSAARGDEVEVAEIAFDTSGVERERVLAERAERQVFWWSAGKQGAIALGLLLLAVFGVRPLLTSLRRRPQVGGQFDFREPALTEAAIGAQLTARAAAALNPEDIIKGRQRGELQGQITAMARSNPEQVAQLIRSWIVGKQTS
jgi:flagellar M-ring protein FliF